MEKELGALHGVILEGGMERKMINYIIIVIDRFYSLGACHSPPK